MPKHDLDAALTALLTEGYRPVVKTHQVPRDSLLRLDAPGAWDSAVSLAEFGGEDRWGVGLTDCIGWEVDLWPIRSDLQPPGLQSGVHGVVKPSLREAFDSTLDTLRHRQGTRLGRDGRAIVVPVEAEH